MSNPKESPADDVGLSFFRSNVEGSATLPSPQSVDGRRTTDLSRLSGTARRGRRAQLRPPLPTSPVVGEEDRPHPRYADPLLTYERVFLFIPSPRLGEGEQSSGEVRCFAQVSFLLRHRRSLIFNFQFSIFNFHPLI